MSSREDGSAALAEIIAEFIERRRRGERPDLAEYRRRHPALAREIEERISVIEFLEGSGGSRADQRTEGDLPSSGLVGAPSLGGILADLPLEVQRLVFLRNFEKRPWREIAETLGRPERELRGAHARVLRELMDYFADVERGGSR